MKAAVIGAGPAGCAAAYTLGKNGHDVALFEAQDHVGGRTSQVMRNGFNLGSGALFLMGGIYPRTNAILKELGHYDDLVPWDARTSLIDPQARAGRHCANLFVERVRVRDVTPEEESHVAGRFRRTINCP